MVKSMLTILSIWIFHFIFPGDVKQHNKSIPTDPMAGGSSGMIIGDDDQGKLEWHRP